MDFGIMFWGNATASSRMTQDYYQGLVRMAQYADQRDFAGIWLPERHFHPWGGQHPNPSVLAAALAVVTRRIRLRAGSVVLPLHNPVRVVEEWAVVDNLSRGRCELSMATGWKDDDFLLAPQKYVNRHAELWDDIKLVQKLWRGESHSGTNGNGVGIDVFTYPRPVQADLPIWITSAGSPKTIADAGAAGFGLLTHLLGQSLDSLGKNIAIYNESRAGAGFEPKGRVALMVHTFVGKDRNRVRDIVRSPLTTYLANSADLAVPIEKRAEWNRIDAGAKAQLVDIAFERYFDGGALLGSPSSCETIVERMRTLGVTEVCCLIDFGLPVDVMTEGLEYLAQLRQLCCH